MSRHERDGRRFIEVFHGLSGIEVDYCPKCRGVWLDRGELDKVIERSADDLPAPQQTERPRHRDDDGRDRDRYSGSQQKPYRKKKSLLGELFDF